MRTVFAVRKDLADIGALHMVPFSSTERIGLEEAGAHIENWISPKGHETADHFRRIPGIPPRRLRRDDFTRRLVRENMLTANDLILPGLRDRRQGDTAGRALAPAVRYSLISRHARGGAMRQVGQPGARRCFGPSTISRRPLTASRRANPGRPDPARGGASRKAFSRSRAPPSASTRMLPAHGRMARRPHRSYVLNEPTVEILIKQALVQAAGVDNVAPSDDGRPYRRGYARRWKTSSISTPASWPIRASTPMPSTACSGDAVGFRPARAVRQNGFLPDGPGKYRRSAAEVARPAGRARTW